ncbi:unnamed protein product [Brassica rapa]|uniref:Cytochrome P450 n=1 Tax=Brassica campestris TaxID=3711 RepID=A0A8D9M1F3_BRACM|nr:unnamed protein product [Brassica rapa]
MEYMCWQELRINPSRGIGKIQSLTHAQVFIIHPPSNTEETIVSFVIFEDLGNFRDNVFSNWKFTETVSFHQHGGVYKLAFGPKVFVVISDPIVAACPQRERGVLAEILEPVMGKGLIPADLDTWKLRRRAITPAFHALYLEAMVKVFSNCSEKMILKLKLKNL